MPRFSVAFGRRKSTADNLENAAVTGPSFRVLERTEVVGAKPFDGGVRLTTMTHSLHKSTGSDVTVDDNIFADLKPNRYVPACFWEWPVWEVFLADWLQWQRLFKHNQDNPDR